MISGPSSIAKTRLLSFNRINSRVHPEKTSTLNGAELQPLIQTVWSTGRNLNSRLVWVWGFGLTQTCTLGFFVFGPRGC